MAKELYLYSPIFNFTAEDFIRQLEENSKEDIVARLNSPGGGVFAGWGMATKLKEKRIGTTTAKIDGMVASMATVLLFYFDKVKATSVSNIMLHRASGPTGSKEDRDLLNKVNTDLRAAMTKRIDELKLKTLKGVSIADIFENEPRPDIYLTAKEAEEIGIVDEIFDMNPEEVESMGEFGRFFGIAANANPQNQNSNKMEISTITIDQLKAQNPQLFADVKKVGADEERDRVQAWAHFGAIDPEAVKKGIESGKPISQIQMIEFMEKKNDTKALGGLKEETDKNKTTAETAAPDDKVKAEKAAADKVEAEKKEFFDNVNNLTGVKIFN